jgi:carbon storage regulator
LLDGTLETSTFQGFQEEFSGPIALEWSAKDWPMLVLSRKKDESIVINNDITIVVVEIRGDKVRLGVEAPKEVPVHRREVFEAIARGEPVDAPAATSVDASSAESLSTPE